MQKKISLASLIATLLITSSLILTVSILLSVKNESDLVAINMATELFNEITTKTTAKIDSIIKPLKSIASISAATFDGKKGVSTTGSFSPIKRTMKAILDSNEQLMSVYLGYANGAFYQLISPRKKNIILEKYKAPANCSYIERIISVNHAGKRIQHWKFLDLEFRRISSRIDGKVSYDPRIRPWYLQAQTTNKSIFTSPYIFSSSRLPGLTCAHILNDKRGVFGMDICIAQLSAMLKEQQVTDNGSLWIVDSKNRLVAFPDIKWATSKESTLTLPKAINSTNPSIRKVAQIMSGSDSKLSSAPFFFELDGSKYMSSLTPMPEESGLQLVITVAAPISDITGHIEKMSLRILILCAAILALIIPIAVYIGKKTSSSVKALAIEAEKIQNFDFSSTQRVKSGISEIQALGDACIVMKSTIQSKTESLISTQGKLEKLIKAGLALSAEKNISNLITLIFDSAKDLVNADGGVIYLKESDKLAVELISLNSSSLVLGGLSEHPAPRVIVVPGIMDFLQKDSVLYHACKAYKNKEIILTSNQKLSLFPTGLDKEPTDYIINSTISAPIITRGDEILGVIQLFNPSKEYIQNISMTEFHATNGLLSSLVAQAAVGLDNRNLVNSLKETFNSLIKVIAASIDSKSPYTGGHCTRVPVLAEMITHAVNDTNEGPLKEFKVETEEEWRQIWIAAWIHDCGKIITPEYVVDKATKLETIYNRIHEIRMRFEVLRRDSEIKYYKKRAEGETDIQLLKKELEQELEQLEKDFSFVAQSNIGGEFMSDEDIEKIKKISERTWVRNYSDRIGISIEELKRKNEGTEDKVPSTEKLLADKPEQLIPRTKKYLNIKDSLGNPIVTPKNEYNRGEIYNLCINRGTLTAEDRFKINEHTLVGIEMLEQIPFPENLSRVPEIAASHHETLVGTGYPLKKSKINLSVEARILAIADIFEALTASDRPYKKAKKISEALKIMKFMCDNQSIDCDIFNIFLQRGVFTEYAQKFLSPDQCDNVEISDFLCEE